MPDLETLICRGGSGGDGRVACETILNADNPPDFPAESFYVSKENEFEWFDRNAFYERKESTKGNSNTNTNSNPNLQRFSFNSNSKSKSKSKASIIGLPKPQTSTFLPDSKSRRSVKPGKGRFFPKRLGSAGKFSLRLSEPGSPKVSCMGRVRSRNRCRSTKKSSNNKPEKTGFWSSFKEIFHGTCRKNYAVDIDKPSSNSPMRMSFEKRKKPAVERDGPTNPPGLGGLNRFVSGRRSDSWAGDAVDLGKVEG